MSTFSSIAELKLSVTGARELLEVSKEMDKVTAKTRDYNKETQNAGNANRKAEADAEKFLKKLRDQSETFGKTKAEIMAYRAAQLGIAKDAQPFIDKLSQSESKSVSFKDTLRDLTGTLKGLGGNLTGVATGGAGAGEGIASATTALRGLGPVAGTAGGLMAGLAVGIGAVVVAGLGLGAAAVAITMQVAGAAAAVDDLSNETGIAAERLSLLSALANEGGSSFDAWNQAATDLATKLAKQDEESGKVAKAIKELGVSTKDANGEQKTHIELMRDVVKAAANHTDAAKGQALGLAALGSNYNKLKTSVIEADEKQSAMYDTMRKTGQLMSTTLAKQSGDFMDKLDHLKGAFTGMANSIATTVLPYLDKFLEKIVKAAETAAGIIRRFSGNSTAAEQSGDAAAQARRDIATSTAAINKLEGTEYATTGAGAAALKAERAKLAGAQERLREASRLFDAATRSEAEAKAVALKGDPSTENKVGNSGIAAKDSAAGSEKRDPFKELMNKTRIDTSEALQELETEEKITAAQKDRIKFLDEIATGKLKVSDQQKAEFLAANSLLQLAQQERKEQEANAEGEKKNRDEQLKADTARIELGKKQLEQLTSFSDKGLESIALEERKFNQLGMTTREITLQNDLEKINLDTKKLIADLTKGITNDEEKATIAAEARAKASELIASRKSLETKFAARDNDGTSGFLQGLKNYAGAAKTTFEQMEEVGSRVAGSLEEAFTNMARNGKFSFQDMARSIISSLGAIFAKMIATKLVNFIFGSFMGGMGGGSSNPGMYSIGTGSGGLGLRAPGFAAGGNVTKGQTAWVGEQGRELVTFGDNATITPAHKMGSGSSSGGVSFGDINITVQGGTTNEDTGRAVADALKTAMKQMEGIADARIAKQRLPGGISNPLASRAF